MLEQVPTLRAFAKSLCGNPDRADDLVQDTLMRAWSAQDSFAAGTNIRAWLFTILRNSYYGDLRRRRYEVEDPDGAIAQQVAAPGGQESAVEFSELEVALARMPANLREVLILVGASGLSYEEAAAITGVAVGTIKSRVNRARERLTRMMEGLADDSEAGMPGDAMAPASEPV